MVLYYGLFALETANNTIAASTSAASEREKKFKAQRRRMTLSSNSWIYTEDLKKHFEERYADYHYICIPIYIDEKNTRYYSHSTVILSRKSHSQSIRQYFSTICLNNNPAFIRDENHSKPFLQCRSVHP